MARKRIEKNLAFDEEKGRYYVYFDYGSDSSGRRRGSQTFRELETAREALCQFELRRLQHRLRAPVRMTVGDWLDYWLEEIVRPNREETTYYCYRGMVWNHIIPALGRIPIQSLDSRAIQHYYGDMLREKKLSTNTVHKHHILLHTALKAAYRQGILSENPVDRVEPPRLACPRQYFYTPEQLKQPKTSHSIRRLGIGGLEDLEELLRREAGRQAEKKQGDPHWTDSGYVVVRADGRPCDPNRVTGDFHSFIQEHDLPPITIHGLRHTFASLANSARVPLLDIGKTLGHKDCAITGRVYTHIFDQTHQEVLNTVAACIAASRQ